MSFDHWTHQYCLACDKQTDGAAYCSESCRLADFESTSASVSTTGVTARNPDLSRPFYTWPIDKQLTKLFLTPAYDFGNPRPYRKSTVPPPQTSLPLGRPIPKAEPTRCLTPSSSHGSLCSLQSTLSSNSETSYTLSEKSKKELQAYANAFDQARPHRRRSC